MIVCDKKRLTEKQLLDFWDKIDRDFPIPLSNKVNIEDYAKKLLDKADLVVDIEEDSIRGLVAGYTQNVVGESAYISIVGVNYKFRGQGLGKKLVKKFIDVCQKKNIQSINLYTHQTNVAAIKMYKTLGFKIYQMENEVRTRDIHYIYYLKGGENKMKNILVTAIGSFAGDVVIKNLRKSGCKVIGCDIYNKEWIADAYNVDQFYQAPPVSDEKAYLGFITEICKEQSIDFIFPLTDIEVDFYHRNRKIFSSLEICPCISCETAIEICRDKMKLDEFLRDREICHTIPTYKLKSVEIKNLDYPVVVKPFNGRSSQGLYYIDTYEQMQYFVTQNDITDYIVQPKISGEVLTVDVIRNQNTSTSGCIVRKELLRTLNGAGTSVKVFRNQELEKTCINIANALNINGCVNFEFIEDENGIHHLIECNPRFSGGVEFSCMSGYDFVTNHLKCFEKKEIDLLSNVQEQFIARKYEEFITEIVNSD